MSTNPWYSLLIRCGGDTWKVLGSEEMMRASFDELVEAMNATDGTASKIVTIEGISDTADRAERRLAVRVENVDMVDLTKWF